MLEHLKFHVLPAVVALLLSPSVAHAEMGGIQDNGAFFSTQAKTEAMRNIGEIGKRFRKDLVFESFREIPAEIKQGVDLTNKAAMGRLYEQWASKLAKQQSVNGIYILLVKDPPHLQILVGNETQRSAFTLKDRDALLSLMLAKLHSKQNDDALREGVNFVNATLRSHLPERGRSPANATLRSHPPERGLTPANQGSSHPILIFVLVILALWVVMRIVGAMISRGSGGGAYAGGGMAPGAGGGGFMSSMLGGMFGAAAGMWIYDQFSGRSSPWGGGNMENRGDSGYSGQDDGYSGQDTDYSGSGGDFGGGDSGGGDFGGGDSGGGDFGGGDSGGGDFGGGDF